MSTIELDPLNPSEALVRSMSEIICGDLRAGRLTEAEDMLFLMSFAAPLAPQTLKLNAELARARGEDAKAEAYQEVMSWV